MTAINPVTDLSKEGELAVLTLNSPPVNALSAASPRRARRRHETGGRRSGCEGDRLDLRRPDLHRRCRHQRVRQAAQGREPVRGRDRDREFAQAGDRRDPRHGTGRRPGSGAVRALPRGGAERALRLAGSEHRASARRGRHPAPAAHRRRRNRARHGDERQAHAGQAMPRSQASSTSWRRKTSLRATAIDFARRVVAENKPLKKVRENNEKVEAARGHPEIFAEFRKKNARKFRGFLAPEYNIRCIEAAVDKPFEEGIKIERNLFRELDHRPAIGGAALRTSSPSARPARSPTCPATRPTIPVKTVGVIGAGTMGGGIAMNFAQCRHSRHHRGNEAGGARPRPQGRAARITRARAK